MKRDSSDVMDSEMTSIQYSSHHPKTNVNYQNLAFQIGEVVLEDHWLVQFISSMAITHNFLKFKMIYYNEKPYNSDGMNG